MKTTKAELMKADINYINGEGTLRVELSYDTRNGRDLFVVWFEGQFSIYYTLVSAVKKFNYFVDKYSLYED